MNTRFAAAAIAAMLVVPACAVAQSLAQAPATAPPGAATQGQGAGPLEACRADVDTLCASDPKTPGWRGKCLRENTAKLSDACKSALAAMRDQRETVRTACAGDIEQHCKAEAAEKDGGRPMRCLKSNEDKLSAGCKSAMTAFSGGGGAASEAAK